MMKPCKALFFLILVLFLVAASGEVFAQKTQKKPSAKEMKIQDMIHSGRYVFLARSAQSMGGSIRHLTSEYELKVSPDTVQSYLPYFGRAYTAPIDPTKGGIEFTSTKFDYTLSDHKKGGWDVTIKPADTRGVEKMILSISPAGYASLRVTSTQRQPITFSGVLSEK